MLRRKQVLLNLQETVLIASVALWKQLFSQKHGRHTPKHKLTASTNTYTDFPFPVEEKPEGSRMAN